MTAADAAGLLRKVQTMKDRNVLKTGAIGAAVTALCCFTPLLVIVLGTVGLSAWLAWLDYVLLPALVVFLGMAIYGLIQMQRRRRVRT